jgi:hypothetical protein
MMITEAELAEALKGLRLWVRHSDSESVAYRMRVMHPESAAKDILASVEDRRQQCSQDS